MEMIGKAAFEKLNQLTDSPLHSDKQLIAKPEIRRPQNDEEARALQLWAANHVDVIPSATVNQLAKHLSFMSATLPSKNTDEESGKMRVAVYSAILRDFSNDALAYMARKACERYDWFPTPRQCLEILDEYRAPSTDKDRALMLCHNYWQGQFEDFMDVLKAGDATQDIVDSVPRRWRMIAMEREYLRHMPETDTFVIRETTIGAIR